ncbi:hypothetical protein [Brevibacterium ihuae]|uniref:hypothetical protein n=1 Tax=Brevibacterium ihuae TaxID=1631743 RepID=UPI001FE5D10C|nr:hypothetical protein [Brevibacterium ihuae]
MFLKATALLDPVVNTHGLADGNGPLGWLATIALPYVNQVCIEAPDDVANNLVGAVASRNATLSDISDVLDSWVHPVAGYPCVDDE